MPIDNSISETEYHPAYDFGEEIIKTTGTLDGNSILQTSRSPKFSPKKVDDGYMVQHFFRRIICAITTNDDKKRYALKDTSEAIFKILKNIQDDKKNGIEEQLINLNAKIEELHALGYEKQEVLNSRVAILTSQMTRPEIAELLWKMDRIFEKIKPNEHWLPLMFGVLYIFTEEISRIVMPELTSLMQTPLSLSDNIQQTSEFIKTLNQHKIEFFGENLNPIINGEINTLPKIIPQLIYAEFIKSILSSKEFKSETSKTAKNQNSERFALTKLINLIEIIEKDEANEMLHDTLNFISMENLIKIENIYFIYQKECLPPPAKELLPTQDEALAENNAIAIPETPEDINQTYIQNTTEEISPRDFAHIINQVMSAAREAHNPPEIKPLFLTEKRTCTQILKELVSINHEINHVMKFEILKIHGEIKAPDVVEKHSISELIWLKIIRKIENKHLKFFYENSLSLKTYYSYLEETLANIAAESDTHEEIDYAYKSLKPAHTSIEAICNILDTITEKAIEEIEINTKSKYLADCDALKKEIYYEIAPKIETIRKIRKTKTIEAIKELQNNQEFNSPEEIEILESLKKLQEATNTKNIEDVGAILNKYEIEDNMESEYTKYILNTFAPL